MHKLLSKFFNEIKHIFNWLGCVGITTPPDLYTQEERLLFRYFNGETWIKADPIVLYKRIMAEGPSLAIDLKVADSLSKDAGKASEEADKRLRTIFSLKPMNDVDCSHTLSTTETLRLFDRFMEYQETVKKNLNPSRTISRPTAACKTTSEEDRPITNIADSGSIASESSTAEPEPLNSAPASL